MKLSADDFDLWVAYRAPRWASDLGNGSNIDRCINRRDARYKSMNRVYMCMTNTVSLLKMARERGENIKIYLAQLAYDGQWPRRAIYARKWLKRLHNQNR